MLRALGLAALKGYKDYLRHIDCFLWVHGGPDFPLFVLYPFFSGPLYSYQGAKGLSLIMIVPTTILPLNTVAL